LRLSVGFNGKTTKISTSDESNRSSNQSSRSIQGINQAFTSSSKGAEPNGTENLTQRNDHASAIAGLLAGTIRLIARRDFSDLSMSAEISQHTDKAPIKYGIGWQRILAELDGLRGITGNLVRQQLGPALARQWRLTSAAIKGTIRNSPAPD
jgi:hypothetical protein